MTTKWDDKGFAIPGSYAIAITHNGGTNSDGWPWIITTVAVCDVCGGWAAEICHSGKTTGTDDDFSKRRTSRQLDVTVYACPEHYQQIMDSLCEEFGWSSNEPPSHELADAVTQQRRLHFKGAP